MKSIGLTVLFALLGTICVAQDKPVIKATSEFGITVQEGEGPKKEWELEQSRDPDLIQTYLVDGKPKKVTFTTNVDSISFIVEVGKKYNFAVEYGNRLYNTQIIGIKYIPTVSSYVVGNPGDVKPPLHGPVLNLEGGGWPGDAPMQQTIDAVRGCTDCDATVDVVVLGAAGYEYERNQSDLYLTNHLYLLNGVDSVQTFVITSPELSNKDEVANAVANADVIFFNGGEQCEYLKNFRGTRVEEAVKAVYKRGGGIGGTSAGLAIQGVFIYDGCGGSVTPEEALVDPYNSKITFSADVFRWSDLANTITDTHLVKRDRIGRTFAFVARQIQDGKAKTVHAIAVDEGTAVVVDKNGIATVVGRTNAYFITGDHKPEVCENGKPLTYSNFKVWKVKPGETYNLRRRPSTGYYIVSVNKGKLSRDPY